MASSGTFPFIVGQMATVTSAPGTIPLAAGHVTTAAAAASSTALVAVGSVPLIPTTSSTIPSAAGQMTFIAAGPNQVPPPQPRTDTVPVWFDRHFIAPGIKFDNVFAGFKVRSAIPLQTTLPVLQLALLSTTHRATLWRLTPWSNAPFMPRAEAEDPSLTSD
jgi:hypothetical protein